MSSAEDQHPVCDLVRAVRTSRSAEAFALGLGGENRHGLATGAGQGRIERCGDLPARSPAKNQTSAA
jgi:hypothetical protein